mmetsp:Transcript_47171/g.100947  ORF Transcript_47171/g.100947 Transcript_47171/m.100947 type:complete len:214 (-) Transcript_47171:653-1294(-)
MADARLLAFSCDDSLRRIEHRPRVRIVNHSNHRSSLEAALCGANRLQAIAFSVQWISIAKDGEPSTCKFVRPKCFVLESTNNQDLFAFSHVGYLLQAIDVIPPRRGHCNRVDVARNCHLRSWQGDRRQLPSLPLSGELWGTPRAATNTVVQLQASLARFVHPRHHNVVKAPHIVGPCGVEWPKGILTSLQNPGGAAMILRDGGRQTGENENLV